MRIGPYPPAREGALDLVLRNPADGMSIQGATVGVTARMRHMEHGTLRSDGIERNGSDATAGSYRVPLHFAMHGEWIVTVTVRHDGLQESFDLLVVVSP
ncbi:MAG: FixH family protein [Chloroflexi bacterium]|nr:FixH family protein [Chloroflexota bacterium]